MSKVMVVLAVVITMGLFFLMGAYVTGEVILDKDLVDSPEENISFEKASLMIVEVEEMISDMEEGGLSIAYVNDVFVEMRSVFEQVGYAEVLRGNVDASDSEKAEARSALSVVSWKDLDYRDVVVYYDIISSRKDLGFLLLDRITVEENSLDNGDFSGALWDILAEARLSFNSGRYKEAEELLDELDSEKEREVSEASVFSSLRRGARGFVERNWEYILIGLFVVLLIVYIIRKIFARVFLKRKIRKMEHELVGFKKLIRVAQRERFKRASISGLVYNIRMEKYNERISRIKEELPVLKSRLSVGKKVKLKRK
jgi:hypothetical protein